MKIEHPNAKNPTPEELRGLDKLRELLEQATADGVIAPSEVEAFKAQVWADGKITPEELDLYQELVISKICSGDLIWSFDTRQ